MCIIRSGFSFLNDPLILKCYPHIQCRIIYSANNKNTFLRSRVEYLILLNDKKGS